MRPFRNIPSALFSITWACSYIKPVNKHICQLFHSNTQRVIPFTPEPLTFSFMSHISSLLTVPELLACITTPPEIQQSIERKRKPIKQFHEALKADRTLLSVA